MRSCALTGECLGCRPLQGSLVRPSCRAAGCCWDSGSQPQCFFYNKWPTPKQDRVQVHLFEWSWADVKAECESS